MVDSNEAEDKKNLKKWEKAEETASKQKENANIYTGGPVAIGIAL